MTAEIAIMNKSGLALAADSKVTIGAGIKAFDTVTKIFSLSRIHPVALMVWGNPDFMEYPIEIICKEYRSRKRIANESTLLKWADDFVSFLINFSSHDDEFKHRNMRYVLTSWFEDVRQNSIVLARRGGVPTTSSEFIPIIDGQMKAMFEIVTKAEDFIAEADVEAFIDKFWPTIAQVSNESVGHYGNEELSKTATLFAMAVVLKKFWSPASMGFVIAGYGEKDMFPGLVEFESDGLIGDALKIKREKLIQVSRNMRGLIQPFAQSDMVHRFMDGADPEYASFADTLFRKSMVESCLAVLDEFGDDRHKTETVRDVIRTAMSKSADEALKIRGKFCRDNFSDPIINMVMMLPKDELPHLAESLVALTSLKRHVSHDAETVGGPIDVALLSKGDGLIWIKRKHYFSAELNPQFTAKYLRAIMGGDDEKQTTRRPSRKAPKVGQ